MLSGTFLNHLPLGKKISPLKYRKTFQIKSPLKPKRVKHSLRTRYKRKNQLNKREIDEHALLNQKYIPLLRSLGMLFDNILGTDSRESLEEKRHKKKRIRYDVEGDIDISCQCPRQREFNARSGSEEEAVTSSETIASEIAVTAEASAATTDNSPVSNIRSFRQHKNVPILPPRNTSSTRRNNNGFGERSRTAHNGSVERYISGNYGDSEHNSERGQEQSDAFSNEKYTDSNSRDDAGGTATRAAIRDREFRNYTKEVEENDGKDSKVEAEENLSKNREYFAKFNGPYKLKTARNEAKSRKFLPKPFRRQREFVFNEKVIDFAESVQTEDINKKGIISITHDSSSDQRLLDGDGSNSTENQKADARTETVKLNFNDVTKPEQYLVESTRATELKSLVVDESHSNQENYSDDDVGMAFDSTGDLSNLNINSSYIKESPETNEYHTKPPTRTVIDETQIPSRLPKMKTILAISEEAKYNEKIQAMIKHGNSKIQISYEDTTKAPNIVKQKPQQVAKIVPHFFSKRSKISKGKSPVVTIIDGYSVTRHKNGENKLAEKAIHIRT